MLETAMEAVHKSREEAFQEAKDKLGGDTSSSKKPAAPTESSPPSPVPSAVNSESATLTGEMNSDDGSAVEAAEAEEEEPPALDQEPPSEREIELRDQVAVLMKELESAQEADRQASVALANSRINALGRFLCNPFHDDVSGKPQQASWLATAVRKEKTRMGSTGNKKKVVTAVDLLERNDTFYNADIEALIEGLPGSEYCKSYVFQAFRTGSSTGLNRSWIHEQQLKQEKEAVRRQKRFRESEQKDAAKDQFEQERETKRRKVQDERDVKKRQKMEEDEEKKKSRVEERLSRLRLQVDDRLFKEACAQREKVVAQMARNLGKEFARRRRFAELVAGQVIVETKAMNTSTPSDDGFELPCLSKPFDEDAIRVWDFVNTFSSFFLERGYLTEIPSLDALQASIDCLKGGTSKGPMSRDDAVSALTDLSVALCKPLAASLTRVLFASLIALNVEGGDIWLSD
jgi:hypothetical protein